MKERSELQRYCRAPLESSAACRLCCLSSSCIIESEQCRVRTTACAAAAAAARQQRSWRRALSPCPGSAFLPTPRAVIQGCLPPADAAC